MHLLGIIPIFSLLPVSLEAEIGLRFSSLNFVSFNLLAAHNKPLPGTAAGAV